MVDILRLTSSGSSENMMSKVASAFLHMTGTNPQEAPPPLCEEAGMVSPLVWGFSRRTQSLPASYVHEWDFI